MTHREFLEAFLKLLRENIDIYENYVLDLNIEEDDWFNIFDFRDGIAAILEVSPLPVVAKELGEEKSLKKLIRKLRKIDVELAKKAPTIVEVFNFKEYRKTLPFSPPLFAWWYHLDKVNIGEIQIPENFPLSTSLYGLSVEGKIENRKCQILIIAPEVPIEVSKKYIKSYSYKFFTTFIQNAIIDLPHLFIDNNEMNSLLLPTSAFWGEFKILRFLNSYISDRYLAIPRPDSKIFNLFLEEFIEKIKLGDKKIFSQKVLTSKEFIFIPLILIRKTTIQITITMDLQTKFEELSKKFSHIPQEVAIGV